MKAGNDRRPVLVTGMHRSGTSWLGKMLCAGGDLVNIAEPLNVLNRQTILPSRVEHWYTYITDENEDRFLPFYRDAVEFRVHPAHDIAKMRVGSPRDPVKILRRWRTFARARREASLALFRDPFAVFSVDWFRRRLDCRVVVIVREPVAVMSSLKRLGYLFDFGDLMQQPLLMRERLGRFRSEIDDAVQSPADIIEHGSLLWKTIYSVVDEYRTAADVCVVRHEDLSRDPVSEFSALYERLQIPFTDRARQSIEAFTNSRNPTEVSLSNPFDVRLDSRANLDNWRWRLEPDEVRRIESATHDCRARYYAGAVT
jgi:hypothetical protein